MAQHPAAMRMSSQPALQSADPQAAMLPAHAAAQDSGACARETPYNHALKRGHRAPEAIAAALAKRAFVRAVPYLVAEGACSLAQLHRYVHPGRLYVAARHADCHLSCTLCCTHNMLHT